MLNKNFLKSIDKDDVIFEFKMNEIIIDVNVMISLKQIIKFLI